MTTSSATGHEELSALVTKCREEGRVLLVMPCGCAYAIENAEELVRVSVLAAMGMLAHADELAAPSDAPIH